MVVELAAPEDTAAPVDLLRDDRCEVALLKGWPSPVSSPPTTLSPRAVGLCSPPGLGRLPPPPSGLSN